MNILGKIILPVLMMGMLPLSVSADCKILLSAINVPQSENVPAATQEYLLTRLQTSVNADGVSIDPAMGQFIICGKFNHTLEDVLAGPPKQYALHTTLTLYVGDTNSETVYASTSLDLRGVGNSTERAYINALRTVNGKNKQIESFINTAKSKIVAYYDQNYPQILAKAERAAAQHNYDEALWIATSIPECSKGYDQACSKVSDYFQRYIDQEGIILYNKANGIWSSAHTAEAAREAFGYLLMIDPESSAYDAAQTLAAEMKRTVKSDRDFELREKYHDAVDLENARIKAARDIGVAFGNGQQPTTTNVNWIH